MSDAQQYTNIDLKERMKTIENLRIKFNNQLGHTVEPLAVAAGVIPTAYTVLFCGFIFFWGGGKLILFGGITCST